MDDTAPKLDSRSHDDVIAQTEALAIAYTTGLTPGPWRPRSDGTLDFGGVLVRLFGGMVDHLIAQLNRAPDKHRAAFTALFGARRTPPRPARVPVTFTRADRSGVAELPAGAQVAATGPDGPVVFETELALALTQARFAAAVVRDVSGPGGYAIQTDIATGRAAGSFAALGGGHPIEHFLYVTADELAAVTGASTVTLTLDGQGAALPSTPIVWASAAPGGGWIQLPPVTVAGSKWIQTAAASALGTITVSGVKARWLRAIVPVGSPSVAITGTVGFNVATATQVDAASVNGQQADFTRDVQPFGNRPQFNDTFFIASDAAFAVAGTTVTIAFAFTTPPGGVNIATDPKLQWEAWDGVHATSLGTTTGSGAVTGGLTDSTKAFSQASGTVVFTLPAAIPRSTIGTVTSRWLRVRLIAGDYGKDLQVDAGGVVTQATFRPPSISSMTLTWTGTTPAQPTSLVVRQTAQTYKFFRGADAAGSLPIFLAAPELSFQSEVETRSSLLLGFDRAFEPVLTTLYLQVFLPASPDPALFGTAPTPRNPPVVVWEYWNGNAWLALVVEDGTLNLARSGLVRFEPPVDAARLTQYGRKLFWLRARAVDLTFSPMPQVGRVLVNTMWASNAHTSTLEVIGSSNGARDQRFTLAQRPVLAGQRIEVGEPESPPPGELELLHAEEGDDVITPDPVAGVTWVRWHEVADFWASGPRDRHYTIDAETGEVTFGNGSAGLIPPIGVQNLRAASYRAGGGAAGNVAAGTVTQLLTTVALVDGVTNAEPAVGGAPVEPEARLLARAARAVRHGGRAVTAQDFSDLALESSGAVARAVTLTPSFSPISEGGGPQTAPGDLSRDGQVIVVIVPADVHAGAAPSGDLCAEVEDYLRARCAPDAQVTVIGPSWVATDVTIELAPTSVEASDDAVAAAREAVTRLLDPLTGGDGAGWDFGRCPRESDFVASLAGLPGIDHVSAISVTCTPAFKDTNPANELLIDELSLYPRLLAYARTITVTASQPQVVP
jgi:hypothetical protein